MPTKTEKQLIRRKKFIPVEIPITRTKIELIANSPKELVGRTIKLDLTRQLKGKSVEMTVKIELVDEKPVAFPLKINLLSYFIRRMIRKRISYVEDSFDTPSQNSIIKIKPFLITKRRVSKRVRKTLRNRAKNWITDYIAEKKDIEIFNEVIGNKMQRALSLYLKKTYPLSLCEIRVLEIIRQLKPEEVPKIDKSKKIKKIETGLDQLKEIEDEKIKAAEKEIQETQKKAAALSDSKESELASQLSDSTESELASQLSDSKESEPITKLSESKEIKPTKEKIKKPKKTKKTKEEEKEKEKKD